MEYHKGLIGLLIIFNIILSGVLIYNNYSGNNICLTGGNCETVQNSQYAQLFGIKLTNIGIIAFAALLGLYIIYLKKLNKHFERLFLLSSIIGALMAVYFIYIQFFILGKICSNCIIIDGFAIIIALLAVYDFKKKKN
jgi:uncharacterized membrane protein